MGRNGSPSDSEDGASARKDVQRRRFFGQTNGLMQWDQMHGCADADAAGGLGHGCPDDHWRGHHGKAGVEMEFGKPGCVKSQFIGQLDLGNGVLVALLRRLVFRAGQLEKEAELHENPL